MPPGSDARSLGRGRLLGLDPGSVRIGVAISDERGRVSVPLKVVAAGPDGGCAAIAALAREQQVVGVVVGHPLSLSGAAGAAAERAEALSRRLGEALDVPIVLQDERLSTVEAERRLAAAGVKGRGRRGVVDAAAAAIILQAYLDRTSKGASPTGTARP